MAAYEAAGETDEWYTPRDMFNQLGVRFDLDVASPPGGPHAVPCASWYAEYDNGLIRPWWGFVWMNPPFGHQSTKRRWLKKFFDHGEGIALLPDRTSAPWWQEAAPRASCVLLTARKWKFVRPDGSIGGSPGTGTTLFAAGDRARGVLLRASSLGLSFQPNMDKP